MTPDDKTLRCADCGKDFTFTAQEQDFYREKGFENEPKRCPDCRRSRKGQRMGGGRSDRSGGGPREMFSVTCDQCGKEAKVPFSPTPGKPVYCSDCFGQKRGNRDHGGRR